MVCRSDPHLKEDASEHGFFQPKMSVLIHGLSDKRRIRSSITLWFTNSCLLFSCLRKKREKKKQPTSNTLFLFSPRHKHLNYLLLIFPLFCWTKNQLLVWAEFWLQICYTAINNVSAETSVIHKLKSRNGSYLGNWRVRSDLLLSSDIFFPSVLILNLTTHSLEGPPKHCAAFQEYFCPSSTTVLY